MSPVWHDREENSRLISERNKMRNIKKEMIISKEEITMRVFL